MAFAPLPPPRATRRYVFRRLHRGVRRRLERSSDSAFLVGSMALFLLTGVGNAVMFKQSTDAMPNYGWFLAVACCGAFIPIFGACVWLDIRRGIITPAMRLFPKQRFVLMGLLDASSTLTGVIGGTFTSGPTQMVLGQTVVPFTLCFSSLLLRHRFHWAQHFGSLVIILGVFAAKLPSFLHGESRSDRLAFNAVFVASCVISSLSQIYKEVAFQNAPLSVNYLQYWVAFFQLFWTLAFAPLNAMSFLGPQRVPLREQVRLLAGGAACLFLGRDSVTSDCGGPGEPVCDACAGAFAVVCKYLFFNVLVNVFALVIVKEGGAALSYVVATLRLPLTTVCFYSRQIMGVNAVDPNRYDFIGMLILLLGLGLYRWGAARLAGIVGDRCLQPDGGAEIDALRQDLKQPLAWPGTTEDQQRKRDEGDEDEEDEEDEDEEEPVVQLGTVILGNGPFVFSVHGKRRPLYLRPQVLRAPPTLIGARRRTLHDLRVPTEEEEEIEDAGGPAQTPGAERTCAWNEPGVSIMLKSGLDLSLANNRTSPSTLNFLRRDA